MSTKSKQRNKTEARNTASIAFTSEGWEDYNHWLSNDADVFQRLDALIADCLRSPFKGIGKPEPLKGDLSGFWSEMWDVCPAPVLSCRLSYGQVFLTA